MTQAEPGVLQLFVDLGSSLTKAFYVYGGKVGLLLMPPTVTRVATPRLDEFLSVNRGAPPESGAWIQLHADDQPIAIGKLAQNFRGDDALKQRKSKPGIYRTLAVLGVVREMLGLETNLICDLGIALPVAEYRDRARFQEDLKAQTEFMCRDVCLEVDYRTIHVQPEGLGLMLDRRAELRKLGQTPGKTVVVMCGHRNLSLLVYEDNALLLDSCRSDGPGFVNAVEIAAKSLGIEPDADALLETVACNETHLRIQGEVMPIDVQDAVAEGRMGYWQSAEAYLRSHLPGGKYDLICGGGAFWSMQQEFTAWLEKMKLPINVMPELQGRITELLANHPLMQQSISALPAKNVRTRIPLLPMQLADAYIGLQTVIAKSNAKAKQQPAQPPGLVPSPSSGTKKQVSSKA